MTAETINYKTQPFAHQAAALEKWRTQDRFALFCEMGTGKTWIAINRAAEIHEERRGAGRLSSQFLILAPRSLLGVWAAELEKHCPIPFEVLVLDKPKKWDAIRGPQGPCRFVVVNYEALLTKRFADLNGLGLWDLVILDESTMVKNHAAQRSKRCRALASGQPRVVILTGNPTPNGPLDLFSQFLILSPGILGFTNFYAFRNRYAQMGGHRVNGKPVQVVGYREDLIEKELRPRMAPHVFRVLKRECLDLPPKLFQIREVLMGAEQAQAYESLRRQAVAEFRGQRLTAPIVIARLTRLSQIAGGFFPGTTPDGEPDSKAFEPNPKVQEVMQILQESEGKAIIWARYRAEITGISRVLAEASIPHVVFHGDCTVEERQDAIRQFQTGSEIRVFLGITACGRFGLTLTEARTVIYFSNSYSFEDRSQSEDRAHRAGLRHPVTYVDLVSRGTIDAMILRALKDKKDLSEFIRGLTAEEVF